MPIKALPMAVTETFSPKSENTVPMSEAILSTDTGAGAGALVCA